MGVLNYLAVGFAFLAAMLWFVSAILWFLSAKVKVKAKEKPDESGMKPAQIIVEEESHEMKGEKYEWDFVETVRLQAKLNAYAAGAAALSALFYLAYMLITIFC